MDADVLLSLSLGKLYAHHANFAGTARQAIADGYSAVDAIFSAILKYHGKPQPRNHKLKLDQVRAGYPDAFTEESIVTETSSSYAPGADWDSLTRYYEQWLKARYENFTIGAAAAADRVRESHAVVSSAMRFLAKKESIETSELEKQVSERAFGFDFSEVSAAISDSHDYLFTEAEIAGEMHGAKLGVKLASATNYCDLDITAGDELTQSILRGDKEIAQEAAMVYHRFIEVIEKLQAKRLDRLSGGKPHKDCTIDELMNAPDFMLSMKARYHGGTIEQIALRWFGVVSDSISTSMLRKSVTLASSVAAKPAQAT